ncbi:MAG: diguanylate cyclase [Planctomycetota bacterium]
MGDGVEKTPESLAALVFKDDLTGLYNRRYLFKWLKAEVKWDANDGPPLSLLMLDLDDFKKINDTRGHLAGDDALRHFAKTFFIGLRPGDVGIRYAGDEFAILCPNTPKAAAAEVGRAFIERLARSPWPPDASRPLLLKASAGLATFPEDAHSPEELVERADEALLHAKRKGKNILSIQGQLDAAHLSEIRALEGIPCPRFIGRAAEVSLVEESIIGVSGGRAALLLLDGVPGTGKTRLLGETVRRAKELGWTCLLERCSEYESALPLQPLVALVEQYVRTHPEDAMRFSREIAEEPLGVLSEHVRVLDAPPDAVARAKALPEATRRKHFFHALAHFLTSLAREHPVLIALDEFQFADLGTLEVVRRLVTTESCQLLVAAARRTNPGEPAAPGFDRLLSGLEEAGALAHLELGPFQEAELIDFLTALLPGAEQVPTLAALLAPMCHGNPLFLEECLKMLILRGVLKRGVGGWAIETLKKKDLPASLDEVIWSRLSTLDPETSRIMAGAAVIGPNFALDVLQGLSGKNQGETQEMLDRAEKARIIAPDAVGEMRFLNPRIQEVTYGHLDAGERRTLQGQVGRIEEAQGANPARLAARFELAGDEEKAKKYRALRDDVARARFSDSEARNYTRRTRSLRRQRVKEADSPLDKDAEASAASLLRTLVLAVKSRKMYPAGSQMVLQSRKAFLTVATEALSRMGAITATAEKGVLHLNGAAADVKAMGALAQESIAFLEERLLRGITLTRDASTEELERLVDLLHEVKPEEALDPTWWDEALDRRGIAHLGAHPRAYVATNEMAAEVSVVDAIGASVREALRSLCAAVDNARMYPPGSQIIAGSLEQLAKALEEALARTEQVAFADVDGALVVNGVAATARVFGTTASQTLKLLKDRQLKSCAVRRGATRDEVVAFVEELAQSAAEGAELKKRLAARGVTHVEVGEARFAAAREGGTKPPAPPPPPTPAEGVAAQARKWIAGNPADLALEPTASRVPGVFERLWIEGHTELFRELAAFLPKGLSSPVEEVRKRVCAVLGASWEKVRALAPAEWVAVMEGPIAAALQGEKGAGAQDALADVALPLLEDRAAARAYVVARRLLWGLGITAEGTSVRARPGLDRRLRQLAERTIGPALLADLGGRDEQARLDALSYVMGLGRTASLALAKALGDAADRTTRETLARQVRTLGKEAVELIRAELSPFQEAVRASRIGEVLDQWSLAPAEDLVLALGHKDPSVWASALVAARKLPRRDAADGLSRAVNGTNPAVAAGAAHAIGELRLDEGLDTLRNALGRWQDPLVLKEVCLALGKLRDANSSTDLIRLATKKGFLWFSKGLPDEVRAAAAWALCEVSTVDAQDAVARLQKDSSVEVRSAIHVRS